MGRRFTAYIDESGDEGFVWRGCGNGATEWFVMAALIVEDHLDHACSKCATEIKRRCEWPEGKLIHWVDVREHDRRKVIVQEIAKQEATAVIVGVHKPSLVKSEKLRQPPGLYLYTTRYLLERVSWFVAPMGRADCVFEKKKNLSYDELRGYVTALIANPNYQIRPIIDSVSPRGKAERKNLQLADCIAGAAYSGLAFDRYGNTEPSYMMALKDRLYRRNGNLFSYGFKLFPVGGSNLAQAEEHGWLAGLEK